MLTIVDNHLKSGSRGDQAEQRAVPLDIGLELLLSGKARLSRIRNQPPIEVVSMLSDRLLGAEAFGISVLDPQITKVLSKTLTQNGIRQLAVDEGPITWIDGAQKLRKSAFRHILSGQDEIENLIDDLVSLRDSAMHLSPDRKLADRKLSSEEERDLGHYNPTMRNVPTDTIIGYYPLYEYIAVPADWNKFCISLNNLLAAMTSTITEAIMQGRIFCIEETRQGARFLSAETTRHAIENRPDSHSKFFFAFGDSLPDKWIARYPRGRRELAIHRQNRALAVLQKVYDDLETTGLKPTRKDVEDVLTALITSSNEQSTAAWDRAIIPNWRKEGPIKKQMKLSAAEFKKLIMGGRISPSPPSSG